MRAFAREPFSYRGADAARGAGDQRDLTGEVTRTRRAVLGTAHQSFIVLPGLDPGLPGSRKSLVMRAKTLCKIMISHALRRATPHPSERGEGGTRGAGG